MAKTKISVSIEESLLERVEKVTGGGRSRSEVVQSALEFWLIDDQHQSLVKDVEAYYNTMGAREREENAEWAELSRRQLEKSWK